MAKTERIQLPGTEQVDTVEPKHESGNTSKGKRKRRAPTTIVHATFRHLEPSKAIQGYAERKLGKMTRFLRKDADVHVVLSVDKYRHWGEATVKAGALTLKTAYQEGRDLYAVIDALAAKVKRQITQHLSKIRGGRTRALATSTLFASQEAGIPELKGR
jgi:ribosomal subunit interface protein